MDKPNNFIHETMGVYCGDLAGCVKAIAEVAVLAKEKNPEGLKDLLEKKFNESKTNKFGLIWLEKFMLFSTKHPFDNCTDKFGFTIHFQNGECWRVKSSESLYHTLKFSSENRKQLAETDAQKAARAGRSLKMAIENNVWNEQIRFVSMVLALTLKLSVYPEVLVMLNHVIENLGYFPCEVQGPKFENEWTLSTGKNLLGACLCVVYELFQYFMNNNIQSIQSKISYVVDTFVSDDENLKQFVLSTYGNIENITK